MSPELDEKLTRKYPRIFAQRHLPPSQTAMCWGFDVGDGWFNLLDALCSVIQDRLDWENCEGKYESARMHRPPEDDGTWYRVSQLEAVQVKEKFGGLRFYADGGDEFARGAIELAETLSFRTCETCGSPGHAQRGGGWVHTLCPEHAPRGRYGEVAEEDEDGEP